MLTEPKNAMVKQYAKLLAMEGVDLEVRPNALKAIARKALQLERALAREHSTQQLLQADRPGASSGWCRSRNRVTHEIHSAPEW